MALRCASVRDMKWSSISCKSFTASYSDSTLETKWLSISEKSANIILPQCKNCSMLSALGRNDWYMVYSRKSSVSWSVTRRSDSEAKHSLMVTTRGEKIGCDSACPRYRRKNNPARRLGNTKVYSDNWFPTFWANTCANRCR